MFIRLISCISIVIGLFTIFDIHLLDFTDELFAKLLRPPKTLRSQINQSRGEKKVNLLKREILSAKETLALTGREHRFSLVCMLSLILFSVGLSIAILMKNYFLLPILSLGFFMIPFWYVKLTASSVKKDISEELETALSVITTAYLRTENIITAVEENLPYLNPPVKTAFAEFLTQVKFIKPDVLEALKAVRNKIDNDVYKEWIDALCDCQHNRSLKTTLTPIVAKLSDMRVVNGELQNLIFEPRKEFIIMALFVLGNPILLYFLNKSWFDVLFYTALGKFILAITVAVIFISTACVIHFTKPIEYKR